MYEEEMAYWETLEFEERLLRAQHIIRTAAKKSRNEVFVSDERSLRAQRKRRLEY